MPVTNQRNVFLINPTIILYYAFFLLKPEKSPEIFPDNEGYFLSSETFDLIYFCSINKQKTVAPIIMQA